MTHNECPKTFMLNTRARPLLHPRSYGLKPFVDAKTHGPQQTEPDVAAFSRGGLLDALTRAHPPTNRLSVAELDCMQAGPSCERPEHAVPEHWTGYCGLPRNTRRTASRAKLLTAELRRGKTESPASLGRRAILLYVPVSPFRYRPGRGACRALIIPRRPNMRPCTSDHARAANDPR